MTIAPAAPSRAEIAPSDSSSAHTLDEAQLADLVRDYAARPSRWKHLLRYPAPGEDRWWLRLESPPGLAGAVDVWLLSWLPGHTTEFHDHGDSAAAFTVVSGSLTEVRASMAGEHGRYRRDQRAIAVVPVGEIHDVIADEEPAISIHAYSPPLTEMTYYRPAADGLAVLQTMATDDPERGPDASLRIEPKRIEHVLREARSSLSRVDPYEARAAVESGAVLIDIRPEINRVTEGAIPGAVVIDRNVLEWRLDPASDARLDLASHDLRPILVCNEGYASSLAAVSLQRLGIRDATDLVGGYRAWRAAGLPTIEPVP